MRCMIFFLSFAATVAFVPVQQSSHVETALAMDRREMVATGMSMAALAMIPRVAVARSTAGSTWFYDDGIEDIGEDSQMPDSSGGKLDINKAFVVSQSTSGWWIVDTVE